MTTINRDELAAELFEAGLLREAKSKTDAAKILDGVLDLVFEKLVENDGVCLGRHGRLKRRFVRSRNYRSLQTTELCKTDPKFEITFEPRCDSHVRSQLQIAAYKQQGQIDCSHATPAGVAER